MSSDGPLGREVREETLRQVKDDLVSGIVETQKRVGMLPDVGKAERFVDPIINEQARKTEEAKPEPKAKPEDSLPGGKPYREAGRFDREEGAYVRPLGTVTTQRDGTATGIDLGRRGQSLGEQFVIRQRLAFLARIPEWRDKVMKAWMSGEPAHVKADRILEILEASYKVFGDPRRPVEKKIIVSG